MVGLSIGCNKTNSLLTNSLSKVSEVSVKDNEHSITTTLDIEKNKDLITEVYKSVESTKVADHSDDKEGQNSSPQIIITFKYNDGTQDLIKSTETGEFIYRNLTSTGWVGGENIQLHEIIDKITAE